MVWVVWSQTSWLFVIMLYLWTASQACRFFVDAKRSGIMELLLVSPLSSRDIVVGQWRALLRLFGPPAALLLIVQLAGAIASQHAVMGVIAGQAGGNAPAFAFQLLTSISGTCSALANLLALIWFGMWMGLVSKNSSMATLRTLLFVQVLPWMGITFASTTMAGLLMFRGIATGGSPSNSMIFTFPLIMAGLSGVFTLAKDAAFLVWARRNLYAHFRTEAARAINLPGARTSEVAMATPRPPVIPA
jgi:hypothetical protein